MINYANLTSGLESCPSDAKLVRIQSSHIELNNLWHVIVEVDYQFLIDAAYHGIVLYDSGSRRGAISRAQWKGVPWIIYAYNRARMGCNHDTPSDDVFCNCINVKEYFLKYFNKSHPLRDIALKKLRYVWKMTQRDLTIKTDSSISTLDGNYEELKILLNNHMEV